MTAPAEIPETVFEQAIAIADAKERASFLDRACGQGSDLRRQAERLVQDHFRAGNFLKQPAPGLDATSCLLPSEPFGTTIGPYKLLEQIGEGGMGVVYVAEQTEPVRRRVALKIIKPGMDSRQVIARFEAERQALAMMDHPHIARILDAGTTASGLPYFVMELVRGLPITDYCDKARQTHRQRLQLCIDVCHAVQHAHQKGIIHRDLKPSNVMVTLHDGTPVVKVIDFGVAKAVGQQLTERTVYTAHTQLVGTPLYMSPEQAEFSGLDVDTRSDVYSLGVLLYELLTGTTPFDKERMQSASFDEMRRIIREEEPETVSIRLARTRRVGSAHQTSEPASTSGGHSPPYTSFFNPKSKIQNLKSYAELDWIVMKSLEKDRTRRYESPSALAADIQRYLDGELVQACPPSPAYRFRKFAKKHKTAFTTAAFVAASLLLGITLSLWQALRATAAEAQATANAVQATANEAKAKTEEQKAKQSVVEAEEQRQQSQKNLEAALDAVNRLLANVNDPELSAVPRVGALQKKMLGDTIAFYDRLCTQSNNSIHTRNRLAHTWEDIAWAARDLGEHDAAARAFDNAIAMMTDIVSRDRYPGYKNELGKFHRSAGTYYSHHTNNYERAEKHYRRSSELFAELINEYPNSPPAKRGEHPNIDAYLVRQAEALSLLGGQLRLLGKTEEAIGCQKRALDLLARSSFATAYNRAAILERLAKSHQDGSAEQLDLIRQAAAGYHDYLATSTATGPERGQISGAFHSMAAMLANRFPHEAEKLFEEDVSLMRSTTSPFTRQHGHLAGTIWHVLSYARHLRQMASRPDINDAAKRAAERLALAESLFEEAIAAQRKMVSQYSFANDRLGLENLLQEESQYLLTQHAKSETSASSDTPPLNPEPRTPNPSLLRADTHLTEAIQLCRALAAEFPDNANYKSRLAELEKLHAQHFGTKPQATSDSKP